MRYHGVPVVATGLLLYNGRVGKDSSLRSSAARGALFTIFACHDIHPRGGIGRGRERDQRLGSAPGLSSWTQRFDKAFLRLFIRASAVITL